MHVCRQHDMLARFQIKCLIIFPYHSKRRDINRVLVVMYCIRTREIDYYRVAVFHLENEQHVR
jgi:hypothetical protein